MSALRAGWTPVCTDLYGDADLRKLGEVRPVKNYPGDLPSLSESLTPMPFLYTGGLENSPDIIATLAERHLLLGNNSDVLRHVRDPIFLQKTLGAAKLPMAEIRRTPPNDGDRWLRKPLHGSGGGGISEWSARDNNIRANSQSYFQRRIEGVPISAVFLATSEYTSLLGVTEQLIGMPEVHAPAYAWCGNIFPCTIPPVTHRIIAEIGRTAAAACDLRGLFGCDFVLDDETPCLIEVNPRYTGSVELIEYRTPIRLLQWHLRACAMNARPGHDGIERLLHDSHDFDSSQKAECWKESELVQDGKYFGKMIVYCDRDGIASDATQFAMGKDHCWVLPQFADIPMPGSRLVAGQPLCTVFNTADSAEKCRTELIEKSQSARRILFA